MNMYQSSVNWSSLLSELDIEKQQELVENCIVNKYKAKEQIFVEDRIPFGVYAIIGGSVKIYKTGERGEAQIFQICRKDDLFGFHPILTNSVYPDSADALTDAEILFIPKHLFLEFIENNTKILMNLVRSLSKEFNKFISQEIFLTQKTVRQRVAIMLVELDKIFREEENEKPIITISRKDLASTCSTTKETLVRIMSEFRKENWIISDGKTTQVNNISVLKKIGYY